MSPVASPASFHAEPSVTEWLLHDDQVMRQCFRHATEILKSVSGATITAVTLLDASHQYYCGEVGAKIGRIPRESSLCDYALQIGGPFVVEDTFAQEAFRNCALVRSPPHVRFYAAAPLRLPDGEFIGALCAMDPTPREMGEDARRVLSLLGEMIESDLQLRLTSAVDPLTQLFNRRSTLEGIHRYWQEAEDGNGLGAVMVDIDWFKQYNDAYGHQRGDSCLKAIAGVLAEAAQKHKFLAGRIGGEEFSLLLKNVEKADMQLILEGVRSNVERLMLDHRASPLGVVTLSVGAVHVLRGSSDDLGYRDAFNSADVALYQAKSGGRNRVHLG